MTEEEKFNLRKRAIKAHRDDVLPYTCEHCGAECTMRAVNLRNRELFLCHSCQIKYSKSLRTPEQKKLTHEKTVKTCLEKYGTINGGNSAEAMKKARETWAKNWGSEEECFKQRAIKAHKTFEEKYNGSYSTPEIQAKTAKTLIDKYGSVEEAYKIRTQKAKETNIKNHGGHHNFVDKDWLKEKRNIMLDKYGVEYIAQSAEWQKKTSDKFECLGAVSGTWYYDNKYFDSFWEIAFYIVLKEHNIEFKYHPSLDLYYTNEKGTISQYRPDFQIGDKLIEIKGDHFFNAEGLPISCRGDDWSLKLKYMESLGVVLFTQKVKPIQTTLSVYNISPIIEEALELKGKPNKYAFIESCKCGIRKDASKTKVLYEKERELKDEE